MFLENQKVFLVVLLSLFLKEFPNESKGICKQSSCRVPVEILGEILKTILGGITQGI